MAILGILFVTGMTFLATMNFESQRISIEREANQDELGVELVESIVDDILRESLIPITGAAEDASTLGEWGTSFIPNPLAWAELPVVHGLIAQIEPYRRPMPASQNPIYGYHTNLGVLSGTSIFSPAVDVIETAWVFDPVNYNPIFQMVDSDGDGIADTSQVPVLDRRPIPGVPAVVISSAQRDILGNLVNGPTTASGDVFLGVRVIPHGGMVNLSESHPSLIRTLFDIDPLALAGFHTPSRNQIPYSPLAEEASLRNRFFLPPWALSPTVVQGDPLYGDPGNPDGDFAQWLFPPDESVATGDHRYWPFDVYVDYDTEWDNRMNPHPDLVESGEYDRRHLVTTISHDDLRSRGGWLKWDDGTGVVVEQDVVKRMIDANEYYIAVNGCTNLLPFEYADYPHTIPNGYTQTSPPENKTYCQCLTNPPCELFNEALKGRLRLSLPWLDEARYPDQNDPTVPGVITDGQRVRLIQDAFTMILLNARSPYWGDFDPATGNWVWKNLGGPNDRLKEIERTAAALTANLIDFADGDNRPTRVELRSADYSNPGKFGLEYDEFILPVLAKPGEFVFGLERQPFITEVATFSDVTGVIAWAVELLNPYDSPIDPAEDTYNDGTDDAFFQLQVENGLAYDLPASIPARGYLVIKNDPGNLLGLDPSIPDQTWLTFALNDTVYLVREVHYDDTTVETIVVDQFKVSGPNTAAVTPPGGLGLWSMERALVSAVSDPPTFHPDTGEPMSPWLAPIPTQVENQSAGLVSLGGDNTNANAIAGLRPVELLFAGEPSDTSVTRSLSSAFPTTGSLLLLMRHANLAYDPNATDLAFTKQLLGPDTTKAYDPAIPLFSDSSVERSEQIDNGRMPVFDTEMVHHFDPAMNPHPDPSGAYELWNTDRPGELYHLPWGQLVFDYFTALPLSNEGPYSNPKGDLNFTVEEAAQPRVDLDGLRVHGRMNINAAPWMALKGLPFIPMEKIPEPFRDTFRTRLSLPVGTDGEAWAIDDQLAKAIVAYREVRELFEVDIDGEEHSTGNYDDTLFGGVVVQDGRGWGAADSAARRGTGFMSVGELANVRHAGAGEPLGSPACASGDPACDPALYRIDSGELALAPEDQNYLDAIAVLASLGDWVSVRSHVFTIYGTIRGEADPNYLGNQADDVDARAIRFQETVDRLPTFIGAPAPVRIGERVLSRYNDLRSD